MPTTNGLSHTMPVEGEYFILENVFPIYFKSLKGIIFVLVIWLLGVLPYRNLTISLLVENPSVVPHCPQGERSISQTKS